MKSIGGYFGLELGVGNEYHPDAIRLNTARNAFEYILLTRNYKKVYMPFYTCDVLWQPLTKLGISFEYYHIDEYFEPVFDFSLIGEEEGFLYTNYFGLKDAFIHHLAQNTPNLIIDNAQGFYALPVPGADTFYSPRKFFGVSDGAYLFTKPMEGTFGQDVSYDRISHLVRRLDRSAEEGYALFVENDKALDNQPILGMSNFTRSVLGSLDYSSAAERRKENFSRLHAALGSVNRLPLDWNGETVPMVYPFLTENGTALRKKLITNRIYTALYWPNVLATAPAESFEYELAAGVVHLPADQRYGEDDMQFILENVLK